MTEEVPTLGFWSSALSSLTERCSKRASRAQAAIVACVEVQVKEKNHFSSSDPDVKD